MFGKRLPLKQLAVICRSLGTTLHAGVPIVKAVELAGSKTSRSDLREALKQVVIEIKSGNQLGEALRTRSDVFPELMISMVTVAEHTGMLPEVLKSLADHYENNLRLKKDFIGQITYPVVQFLAAVLIIAGMIFLLGVVGTGPTALDPLGFGLHGSRGALIWLGGWAAVLAGGTVAYQLLATSPSGHRALFRVLMRIPVVGGCLEAFAVARFSWALYLTQESGMPIEDSLHASLRATANGAFIAAGDQIVADVQNGESLTDALAGSELFSEDFLQMVHVGETTGTVPETLHRLSPQFEEQARRSLRALATAAGWVIRAMVAGFIIFLIFRIMFWYVAQINANMP